MTTSTINGKIFTYYSIGDRFTYNGEQYLLAQMEPYKITLINLRNGNRWEDPIFVGRAHRVTKKELRKLTGRADFSYLEPEK